MMPHTDLQITISCPIIFSWISSMVWNFFPLKGDFSFGKSQKSQGTKSGLWWGWVTWVIWCFTTKICTRWDTWVGIWSWWSFQSPVAHRDALLNHLNSFHKSSSLTWNLKRIMALLPQSYWMWQPHSTHAHSIVSTTLWLLQWSRHCSCMHITVHSPWLPGLHRYHTNHSHYIHNGWMFSGQISYIVLCS